MYVEEVLKTNKHIDYLTAVKLTSWINRSVIPPESDGKYEEIIVATLESKESTYDPSKGNLLYYLKTSINLTLLTYKTKGLPDYHSVDYDNQLAEMDVDMEVFSDREILAMFRVKENDASTEDIEIVKGLVDA